MTAMKNSDSCCEVGTFINLVCFIELGTTSTPAFVIHPGRNYLPRRLSSFLKSLVLGSINLAFWPKLLTP